MITVTIQFSNKEQAIEWLNQYEGGIEQSFDEVQSTCNMSEYIPEMQKFRDDDLKTNFDLKLQPFEDDEDEDND